MRTTKVTALAYMRMIHWIRRSMGLRMRPSRPVGLVSARSRMAASAGERVSALKAEIAMEKAIVSENCL